MQDVNKYWKQNQSQPLDLSSPSSVLPSSTSLTDPPSRVVISEMILGKLLTSLVLLFSVYLVIGQTITADVATEEEMIYMLDHGPRAAANKDDSMTAPLPVPQRQRRQRRKVVCSVRFGCVDQQTPEERIANQAKLKRKKRAPIGASPKMSVCFTFNPPYVYRLLT